MTTFYLKTPNNRIPIVKALETILMGDDEIIEIDEINILDDLHQRGLRPSLDRKSVV